MNAHKVCSPNTAYHRRNYVPSNTGIEAWGAPGISECALCGDRAKKEVSRVEWGYTGSAQSITVQGGNWTKRLQECRSLKEKPCEDSARRWSSGSPGGRPQERPNLATPWSWTSSLQICEKTNFCCLSHPGCDILLVPLANKYINISALNYTESILKLKNRS